LHLVVAGVVWIVGVIIAIIRCIDVVGIIFPIQNLLDILGWAELLKVEDFQIVLLTDRLNFAAPNASHSLHRFLKKRGSSGYTVEAGYHILCLIAAATGFAGWKLDHKRIT
jgi:hypothetical protein